MGEQREIADRLAERLKAERKAKGLSLEALSNLSGVSRSMLSQIERGESSPTVASLWNLTRALNVDFSALLDNSSDDGGTILAHVRADQTPEIRNRGAGCLIRILSAPEDVGATEIYKITFAENAALESTPHNRGAVENLTVLDGSVEVTSGDRTVTVTAGDTLRYAADVPHAICSAGGASVILVVKNA